VRLASSALAMVGTAERVGVLAAHCGGVLTWSCLGSVAGAPWTTVGGQAQWQVIKPGHASPVDSASGLLVFANAVVSYFGREDLSARDLGDPGFRTWVRRLEQAVPSFGDAATTPYEQWLLTPSFDVVGTIDAEIRATPPAPAKQAEVLYPSPMGRADAVAVSFEGRDAPQRLVDAARDALVATAWDEAATGDPAGLPPAGTLEALQALWEEVS
jgi:hypothetical protein